MYVLSLEGKSKDCADDPETEVAVADPEPIEDQTAVQERVGGGGLANRQCLS